MAKWCDGRVTACRHAPLLWRDTGTQTADNDDAKTKAIHPPNVHTRHQSISKWSEIYPFFVKKKTTKQKQFDVFESTTTQTGMMCVSYNILKREKWT